MLPESTNSIQNKTPLFYNYMRRSQNLSLLPEYTPPPLIYATLPEYTPPPEYTPFSTTICDTPIIYPLSQNMPFFEHLYSTLPESTRPTYNIGYSPFKHLYVSLSESTPPSKNIPPFLQRDSHRIYPSFLPGSVCML